MIFRTTILEYLNIRPLPNSKLSPISFSQPVTTRKKTVTNSGENNRNCYLSPNRFHTFELEPAMILMSVIMDYNDKKGF